jgi:hypothetical protein
MHLRSFLLSLFIVAHCRVQLWCPSSAVVSYKCMARKFYDFLADPMLRNEFYNEVVADAQKHPSTAVWSFFMTLKNGLKECCCNWLDAFYPLLLLLDEVHMLYTDCEADIRLNYTLYLHLKSVLNEVSKKI